MVQSKSPGVLRSKSAGVLRGSWRVDRGSKVPAYVQIERRLMKLIESGRLTVGDRLPSERELAACVGVSRVTARAALDSLTRDGLLERGIGRRGTVVARSRLIHDLTSFTGFTEMARRQGRSATARLRSINELDPPDGVATELGLKTAERVYRIERLRFADGEPVTLEDSWVPAGRFPDLLAHDLRGSLYELMRDAYGTPPVRATERLEPAVAGAAHARALGVKVGAPLMLIERVAYAGDGVPVEFARDHHRGDRAQFVVEVPTAITR